MHRFECNHPIVDPCISLTNYIASKLDIELTFKIYNNFIINYYVFLTTLTKCAKCLKLVLKHNEIL